MITEQRIIFSDDGTLVDLSRSLNDYKKASSAVVAPVAGEDYLYVGTDLPFMYRYFDVAVANATAAVPTVEIWDGTEWELAVDVVDETAVSGASLGQKGFIRWAPQRNGSGWGFEDTTEDIPDLSTLRIQDFYWARFSWSDDLDGTTALYSIGFKFSEDGDLAPMYPDLLLSATLTNFQTGKTNWDEQHFLAAREILRYLRQKRFIENKNQVLEWDLFREASCHKVAEIAYRAFGPDFDPRREQARKDFFEAMNQGIMRVDRNMDGRVDPVERFRHAGLVRR